MRKANHDWLVFLSLALIRFIRIRFWPAQTCPLSGSFPQGFCRINPEPFPVFFYVIGEVAALIERVPGQGVQKRKSIHQTQVDLGSQTSSDVAHKGLEDPVRSLQQVRQGNRKRREDFRFVQTQM